MLTVVGVTIYDLDTLKYTKLLSEPISKFRFPFASVIVILKGTISFFSKKPKYPLAFGNRLIKVILLASIGI